MLECKKAKIFDNLINKLSDRNVNFVGGLLSVKTVNETKLISG